MLEGSRVLSPDQRAATSLAAAIERMIDARAVVENAHPVLRCGADERVLTPRNHQRPSAFTANCRRPRALSPVQGTVRRVKSLTPLTRVCVCTCA